MQPGRYTVLNTVLNTNHLPLETIHYTPYGAGSPTASLHGFTGEPTDASPTHIY